MNKKEVDQKIDVPGEGAQGSTLLVACAKLRAEKIATVSKTFHRSHIARPCKLRHKSMKYLRLGRPGESS